jgi:hypothetical protein
LSSVPRNSNPPWQSDFVPLHRATEAWNGDSVSTPSPYIMPCRRALPGSRTQPDGRLCDRGGSAGGVNDQHVALGPGFDISREREQAPKDRGSRAGPTLPTRRSALTSSARQLECSLRRPPLHQSHTAARRTRHTPRHRCASTTSPRAPLSPPRSTSSCAARAIRIPSESASHRRVEPSTSVNRNVTIPEGEPAGSADIQAECHTEPGQIERHRNTASETHVPTTPRSGCISVIPPLVTAW